MKTSEEKTNASSLASLAPVIPSTPFSASPGVVVSPEALKLKEFNEAKENNQFWSDLEVLKLRRKDLRRLLERKGHSTNGRKWQLRRRLVEATQHEKREALETLALHDAALHADVALEEKGSVYSCGRNDFGQLGWSEEDSKILIKMSKSVCNEGKIVDEANEVSDTCLSGDSSYFRVIEKLKGKEVVQVSCNERSVMVLTKDGDVYSWGQLGSALSNSFRKFQASELGKLNGNSKTGKQSEVRLKKIKKRRRKEARKLGVFVHSESSDSESDLDNHNDAKSTSKVHHDFVVNEPLLIKKLQKEEIVCVARGCSFSAAVSEAGDLYMWGENTNGQLTISPRVSMDEDLFFSQPSVVPFFFSTRKQ